MDFWLRDGGGASQIPAGPGYRRAR